MKPLRDIVTVITGASSGNGAAIARHMAQRGATVVLAARGQEGLERIERECVELGARTLVVPTDAGHEEQIEALAAKAVESFGRIDVWVNCAAVLAFGPVEDIPGADLEKIVRTNLLGYLWGTRVALRQFREQGRGVLINISSVLGTVGSPYVAAYSATKWAVRGMTECVRDELRDSPHIHACTVLPAALDTPIFRNAANYSGLQPRAPEPIYSPERVAAAVVSLIRTYMGLGLPRTVARAHFRLPGQLSSVPRRVLRQSSVLMKTAMAPPCARKSGMAGARSSSVIRLTLFHDEVGYV